MPINSFSLDPGTATEFAKDQGAIIAAIVPRGRIFSTPRSGVGCTKEAEIVVLGGKMEATVEDTYILIGDKNLSVGQHLTTFLEEFSKVSNKLVVIAPDITDTALQVLVVNKVRGIGSISAVKAPLFGEKQKSILQDMCVLTGATDKAVSFRQYGQ